MESFGRSISKRAEIGYSIGDQKILFAGNSVGDLETLGVFMINVWTCFYNALFWQDQMKDKDQLIAALEDRKLA